MFDFLKRKKENDIDFNLAENSSDEAQPLNHSNDIGGLIEPRKPEIFNAAGPDTVAGRDMQLILARMDLVNKRLDDIDKKLEEILELAKK